MPFRTQNQKSAQFLDAFSQFDVRAPTGHIGRNRNGPRLTGLGNDLRFFFMKLGVKDGMTNIGPLEHPAENLRRLDRGSSDQDRLAFAVSFPQVIQHLIELLPAAFEHQVVQILSYAIPVGRNNHHSKPVNVVKLALPRFPPFLSSQPICRTS